MKNFARELARIRKESGFATPYAFYHKNGGKHAFPFTFAYYLKIERGESLPRPQWLPSILSLLRIPPTEDLYRKFITGYFKDVCGDENTYQALIAPLLCRHIEEKPEKQAAKRLMTEKAYHISPEQFKTILTNHATCWTFECLVNDRGAFTPEKLADILELPKKDIRDALKKLIAKRLVKCSKSGRFSSPLATKFYVYPRTYKNFEKDRARLWLLEEQMSTKRGGELFNGGILMRAEEGAVRRAMRGLSDSIEAAGAYSVDEKGDGTGLFLLQARVRKMFNF